MHKQTIKSKQVVEAIGSKTTENRKKKKMANMVADEMARDLPNV